MKALRSAAIVAVCYATALGAANLAGALPRHRAETAWFIAAALAIISSLWRRAESSVATRAEQLGVSAWTLPVFVVLAVLLFAPTIAAGFFSDDFVLLSRAAAGSYSMGNGFFRPLPMVVWSGLLAVFGHTPAVFHLVNILLHGLNAYLVTIAARSAGLSPASGLLAGVLFLVHPVTVEAVTWVSALFDVAATCGALVFIVGVVQDRRWWQWAGLAAAFLSKETAVAAPVIALAFAYPNRARLRAALEGLLAVGAAAALRVWLLPVPEGYAAPPDRYMLKELLSRTFGTLGAPWSAADALWPAVLPIAATAAIGLLLAIAVMDVSSPRPRLVLTAFAVLVSVLPVYRYLFISPDMENARYLYMGAAFWAIGLATTAGVRTVPAFVRAAGAALLIVTLGAFLDANLARQRAWGDAAELRDRVLANIAPVVKAEGCDRISVTSVPDSLRGVYVFRNGFAEAVEQAAGPRAATGRDCSGNWDGERLTPDR